MKQKKYIAIFESEKINLTNMIKLFWNWKYYIVSIILVFSLISLGYSYTIQNKYQFYNMQFINFILGNFIKKFGSLCISKLYF